MIFVKSNEKLLLSQFLEKEKIDCSAIYKDVERNSRASTVVGYSSLEIVSENQIIGDWVDSTVHLLACEASLEPDKINYALITRVVIIGDSIRYTSNSQHFAASWLLFSPYADSATNVMMLGWLDLWDNRMYGNDAYKGPAKIKSVYQKTMIEEVEAVIRETMLK